jgi:hypothetical protein
VLTHDSEESGCTAADGPCWNRVHLDDLSVDELLLEGFSQHIGNTVKVIEGAQFREPEKSWNQIYLCHSKTTPAEMIYGIQKYTKVSVVHRNLYNKSVCLAGKKRKMVKTIMG